MSDRPITCEMFDDMLPDLLEGTMAAEPRAALEAHAEQCRRCASLLTDLRRITHDAASLPDLTPPRDLWPEIAARIETPVVALPPRSARRVPHRGMWYAAAAAVLVAASSGITWLAMRSDRTTPGAATPSAVAAMPAGVAPSGATSTGIVPTGTAPAGSIAARTPGSAVPVSGRAPAPIRVERVYDQEIAALDSVVRLHRSDLDTATVAIIERNLRIIDSAIAQSRAALARDPHSNFLNDQLNNALGQKVELLRTVALLPTRT